MILYSRLVAQRVQTESFMCSDLITCEARAFINSVRAPKSPASESLLSCVRAGQARSRVRIGANRASARTPKCSIEFILQSTPRIRDSLIRESFRFRGPVENHVEEKPCYKTLE